MGEWSLSLFEHDGSQLEGDRVKPVRQSVMVWAIGLMIGFMASVPSATPDGGLSRSGPFQLVVKLRTITRLESLTAAQRVQITNSVQHHRNAVRTAPTEELQMAAATVLVSDVEEVLTPTQRAEVTRTVNAASRPPHVDPGSPGLLQKERVVLGAAR